MNSGRRSRSARRAVLAWCIGVTALTACREEAAPPELPPRAIQWMRVSAAVAGQQRVLSGIVTSISDTRLAFEVGGTVATVEVDLGDAVEKGQVLARLDLARRDLRRSVLEAPFRGKVSVRQVDAAMKLASGQIAFELDAEDSGLRVEVQMPETLIARVRQGDEVAVGFPSVGDRGADGRHPALVSEVGTRAGVGNAFPVRADLLAPPSGVRPGMTAEVTFSLAGETGGISRLEGFMIPIAAAHAGGDDRFSAFVFDPESSTLTQRPIVTGGVRDNDIAVLEGLEAGDIIATAGVPFLRDGQTVTLLDGELGGTAR